MHELAMEAPEILLTYNVAIRTNSGTATKPFEVDDNLRVRLRGFARSA